MLIAGKSRTMDLGYRESKEFYMGLLGVLFVA